MVACRFCGAPLVRTFVDLGTTPLANSYLPPTPEAVAAERRYPLRVMVCDSCLLVQVEEAVPAEAVFAPDYAYLSSYSESWLAHSDRYAAAMIERFGLGPESLVVEIASNDGYLLRYFRERGVPVLGVEPAAHAAALARTQGIPTEVMFFNATTAPDLAARGIAADLMPANNVFAHVPDIGGFVAGFPHVLKPEGVITFEFPHLLNLIAGVQFDTIYHEHYSYLSLLAAERVLASAGLRAFDVEELPTHGGSLRLFACRAEARFAAGAALAKVRADEAAAGLDRPAGYDGFAGKVEGVKAGFRSFLAEAKAAGKTVAAYGAAAKGNTFLNVCGASADDIAFVVDRNPEKQGKLLPGSHVPVRQPEALYEMQPDYVLILPWNLAAEIRRSHAGIAEWGGRFVTAVPEIRIY
jgi:SAM-dependent methyltransferase